MPLSEGLIFVHNALVGVGLRDRIRLGASGKIVTAFDIARVMALGADWCNAARGFMFAVGCIQSQSCHTDHCPTGVATQDPMRQRALVVPTRPSACAISTHHAAGAGGGGRRRGAVASERVTAAHFSQRARENWCAFRPALPVLAPGELLAGSDDPRYRDAWKIAAAESFAPAA